MHRIPRAQPLSDQLDFANLRLVVIHDSWVGYSDISPLVRSYILRPGADGGLAGDGRLTTGRGLEREAAVKAAPRAARDLLAALESTRMQPIPYQPFEDHTDDYPHIEIAVHTHAREIGRTGGFALFHTTSQGPAWAPWAVSIGGAAYVVEGDAVGRAYAAMAKSFAQKLPEE